MPDANIKPKAMSALLKVLAIAVSFALIIWAAIFGLVKATGIGQGVPSAGPASSSDTSKPLPTVAIEPTPTVTTESPTPSPSPSPTESESTKLQLTASPERVSPGAHINLTGTFAGPDGMLEVQRKEGGRWTSFAGVRTPVTGGAFATYITTTRTGAQQFRVVQVGGSAVSNSVNVRVG
ncbi:MAG: hypothetical protein V9E81_02045 [Marmoricola sp.]